MLPFLLSPARIAETERIDGPGLDALATILSGSAGARVLVVRDPRPFPALDAAIAGLSAGRPVLVLDRVVPNPASADVMTMVEEARAFKPDALVAVGGGSTLDSAKAVALLVANPGDLDEYLGPEATRRPETAGPPLACLPTTAGTGAEVTRFAVFTARTGRKYTLAHELLRPRAAVLVADFVAELPRPVLAATGFDAITHALETLWNRNATPATDAAATEALVACLSAYEECLARPSREANRAMLRAACAAGCAFDRTGTALIHALSFPLSETWGMSHGAACAFFSEDVYELAARDEACARKLAAVERALSGAEQDAEYALFDRLSRLRELAGLPSSFAEEGIETDRETALAAFARVGADPKTANFAVSTGQGLVDSIVARKLA